MTETARPPLGALIGAGASAHVYASSDGGGRAVVVKVLRPELARDAAVRARFLREARAAAQVSHPRLVPVLRHGDDWLVLPYLAGGSLEALLADGPLEPGRVVGLVRDVAGALDALHAAGIVHRDLKPSNILFDDDGRASVADFGLARDERWTKLTAGGALLGTPSYLAPEVIAGADPSPASDIYALGCILWEALCGTPPFVGRSVFDLGLAHLQEEPPALAASADADLALRSALAKDPARRPATAQALASLLQVALR